MPSLKSWIMRGGDSIITCFPVSVIPNTLLIVRLDEIGDYILFRNFLSVLRESELFRDFQITLLGNSFVSNLAEQYDSEHINNFIWIDKKRFLKDYFYRIRLMIKIRKMGFETVLIPTFSRRFLCEDAVAKVVAAPNTIAPVSDGRHQKQCELNKAGHFYSRIVPVSESSPFEFYRNRAFFSTLLNHPVSFQRPVLAVPGEIKKNDRYAVLFPGAGEAFRQWSSDAFARIAQYLHTRYGLDVVVSGGAGDKVLAERIAAESSVPVRNMTGKTSISELVELIAGATLIVTNDTGAVHIAAAVQVPTVCISNANHFGRFVPYPTEITDRLRCVFPSDISENNNEFEKLVKKFGQGSNLSINSVTSVQVIEAIDHLLESMGGVA